MCEHGVRLSKHCDDCCTRKKWLRTQKCKEHNKWLYECRECRHAEFLAQMAKVLLHARVSTHRLRDTRNKTVAFTQCAGRQ